MTQLTTLHLRTNNIGDNGVLALIPSLKKMSHLTTLEFSCNNIGDIGRQALVSINADAKFKLFL